MQPIQNQPFNPDDFVVMVGQNGTQWLEPRWVIEKPQRLWTPEEAAFVAARQDAVAKLRA